MHLGDREASPASVSRVKHRGNRIEIPLIERTVLSGSWRGLEEGRKALKIALSNHFLGVRSTEIFEQSTAWRPPQSVL